MKILGKVKKIQDHAKNTPLQMLLRGQNILVTNIMRTMWLNTLYKVCGKWYRYHKNF